MPSRSPFSLLLLLMASAASIATSPPGSSGDTGVDTSNDTGVDTHTDTHTDSSSALTPAPDLAALVDEGGCADVVMHLGSEAGDLVLVFNTPGLTEAAFHAMDKQASVTLDLATEYTALKLWEGVDVTNIPCNDALYGTEEVHTTWTTLSGSADLQVTSLGEHKPWDAYPGDATLTLTDVVLTADGAEDVRFDSLSWSAAVGWLPG